MRNLLMATPSLDERLINECFFVNLEWQYWGCSSFGRARRSQRRGSEFDPRQLHHSALNFQKKFDFIHKNNHNISVHHLDSNLTKVFTLNNFIRHDWLDVIRY